MGWTDAGGGNEESLQFMAVLITSKIFFTVLAGTV